MSHSTSLWSGILFLSLISCTKTAPFKINNDASTNSGVPDFNLAVYDGNNQASIVGQTLPSPIQVRVTDSDGTPIENKSVTWSSSSGSGSLSSCSNTTNASGYASCVWTLGTLAGNQSASASILDGAEIVNFEATGTHAAADHLVFTTQPAGATAGQAFTVQPAIAVVDLYGNLVSTGADASAAITMSLTSGTGTLSGTITKTATSGVAIWSDLQIDSHGSKTITATKSDLAGSGGTPSKTVASDSFSVATNPPSTPLGLTAQARVANQIDLAWDASAGASSYVVLRGTSSGSLSPITTANTNSFSDTSLAAGTTYYYAVQAVSLGGTSSATSEITAIPLGSFSLTSTIGQHQGVVLTWGASAGATSYTIKYGTSSGAYSQTFSTSAASSTTVTGLTNGTTYYFIVEGHNSNGFINASAETSLAPGLVLSLQSGDGQSGIVATTLPTTISVVLKDSANHSIAGASINWNVTGGGGSLSSCSSTTNASGVASCSWTLGTTSGSSNNTVRATEVSSSQNVDVTASATHGPASSLRYSNIPSIDLIGENLKTAPLIEIIDQYSNVVTSGPDATAEVSVQISSGTGAIHVGATSCSSQPSLCKSNATNGVVTFSGLRFGTSGDKVLEFTKASTTGNGGTGGLTVTMENPITIAACNSGSSCPGCWTYTTPGSHTWTVPSNWNSASQKLIELIGGGGGGGAGFDDYSYDGSARGGGGGGGGGFAYSAGLNLTAGTNISISIGAGGAKGTPNGAHGESTYFHDITFLTASGGSGSQPITGGTGGSASGTALTSFGAGGNGSDGGIDDCAGGCYGGGGGGGAGSKSGNGANGSPVGGVGGGINSSLLFTSGSGGNGAPIYNWSTPSSPGANYGGGGGGASTTELPSAGASGAAYLSCK
jgi:hypothetical protein